MVGCEALLAEKETELNAYWRGGGCGGEVLGVWDAVRHPQTGLHSAWSVFLTEAVHVVVDFHLRTTGSGWMSSSPRSPLKL